MPRNDARRRAGRAALALALAIPAAGCTDYLARRETLSMHSGDAVAYNKALQVIDPWPVHSARTSVGMDGQRAQRAIERYHSGEAAVAAPASGAAPAGGQPPAGGAGGGAGAATGMTTGK